MTTEWVRVVDEEGGAWRRVAIGAPPGNILSLGGVRELGAAVDASRASHGLRWLTVEGVGAHFSYGASIPEHLPVPMRDVLPAMHALFKALLAFPAPTAALVDGRCLGGGFELARCCDDIIATAAATFGLPEIRLGAFPPAAAALLPVRVGASRAARAIVTGDPARDCVCLSDRLAHPERSAHAAMASSGSGGGDCAARRGHHEEPRRADVSVYGLAGAPGSLGGPAGRHGRRRDGDRADRPWVLHRRGKAMRGFRKAWHTACERAGCPGRIPHDLRRTAVRNPVRFGVSERVAMMLSGHKTRSVFERHNVVSENDLNESVTKLAGTITGTIDAPAPLRASGTCGRIAQLSRKNGAGGGNRTHTLLAEPGILSPVRLPVSPPRLVFNDTRKARAGCLGPSSVAPDRRALLHPRGNAFNRVCRSQQLVEIASFVLADRPFDRWPPHGPTGQ